MVNIVCRYGQVVMKVNDYVLKQALEFDVKGQKEDKRLKNVLTFLVSLYKHNHFKCPEKKKQKM